MKHNYPPEDSFHWRDDIFFGLQPNGHIRCWKFGVQLVFDIPAVEWDSVVQFISDQRARAALATPASTEQEEKMG